MRKLGLNKKRKEYLNPKIGEGTYPAYPSQFPKWILQSNDASIET